MKGKIIKVLWWLFGAFWALVFITFVLIWFGIIGYMPDVEQLQNPIDKYASVLISDDGVQLGSYAHSSTNRIYVGYDELAEPLVQALVATEDVRFYKHSGVDVRGVGRAVIKRGVLRNTASGGGSTITQQLAKQLYSPHAKSTLQRPLQRCRYPLGCADLLWQEALRADAHRVGDAGGYVQESLVLQPCPARR